MYKGLKIVRGLTLAAIIASGTLAAQVYKVVDENGNVTYTDQPPSDGSAPMVLPDVSVVEGDDVAEAAEAASDAEPEADAEAGDLEAAADPDAEVVVEKTPRELRQEFRDFRILSPGKDETFWGTSNTVVVSWGASAAYEPGMSVSVVVNGETHDASPTGNLSLTLDRGEHKVHAVLLDHRGRRIVTTNAVTFYIKQASARINPG